MLQNFYNFSLSSVTFPFFFYNLYLNEVFIKCTTGIFFRNIDIRFLIFYLNKTKPFGITDKCSCQIRFFSFIFSPLPAFYEVLPAFLPVSEVKLPYLLPSSGYILYSTLHHKAFFFFSSNYNFSSKFAPLLLLRLHRFTKQHFSHSPQYEPRRTFFIS